MPEYNCSVCKNSIKCPVCQKIIKCFVCKEEGGEEYCQQMGDRKEVNCSICDFYFISGTAIEVLKKRTNQKPDVRKRLSNYIKLHSSKDEPLNIVDVDIGRYTSKPSPLERLKSTDTQK